MLHVFHANEGVEAFSHRRTTENSGTHQYLVARWLDGEGPDHRRAALQHQHQRRNGEVSARPASTAELPGGQIAGHQCALPHSVDDNDAPVIRPLWRWGDVRDLLFELVELDATVSDALSGLRVVVPVQRRGGRP